MSEARQRMVAGWLAKAAEDLKVARLLIEQEHRLFAAGAYHCQQAAVKAWLTSQDLPFPKTHDLEALLHLCRGRESGFATLADHARTLTPLATTFRYPGDVDAPTPAEARQMLAKAEETCAFVIQLLAATGEISENPAK